MSAMVLAVSCMHPAARQTCAEPSAAKSAVAIVASRRQCTYPRQRRPQLLTRWDIAVAYCALCNSLAVTTLQQRQSACAHVHRPAEPVLDSRRAPAVKQSVDSSGEVTMEDQDDEDIEAKMEEFLRLQAERESGMLGVACVPVANIREQCTMEPDMLSTRCIERSKVLESVLVRTTQAALRNQVCFCVLQASHLWRRRLRLLRSRSA